MGLKTKEKDEAHLGGDNHNLIENLSSRWVITSSIDKMPSDGPPGEGSPFANSLVRVLLNNSERKLSVIQFFQQIRDDLQVTYQNLGQVPGLGILKNSVHQGGEFCFKLRNEFILHNNNPENNDYLFIETSIKKSIAKLEREYLNKLEESHKRFEEKLKILAEPQSNDKKSIDKENLLKLLSKSKFKEFFEEVKQVQNEIPPETNELLMNLMGRWHVLENIKTIGTVTFGDESVETNSIRIGLIRVISGI